MAELNSLLVDTPFSVFEKLEISINNSEASKIIKLHQGKTIFEPCVKIHNWNINDFPLLPHEHSSPLGIKKLKDKIIEKISASSHLLDQENVLITSGATHAIGIILRAILKELDEVLILSPQWLFIRGLVNAAGGKPIEVPIFLDLDKNPDFDFIQKIKKYISPKSKVLYFNSPNNPTGYSFTKEQLTKLLIFAKANNLWLIADNAYENYDFSQDGFIDILQLSTVYNKIFSVYSFSKTYAMPGYRIGYMLINNEIKEHMKKWILYSVYALSTISQYAAYQALCTNEIILLERHNMVKRIKDYVLQALNIPHTITQGGLYTFLDLRKLKKFDVDAFIMECIKHGITLAPGVAFGLHCKDYARLCFTAASFENVKHAIEIINNLYMEYCDD